MTPSRLAQLHSYAQALALQPYVNGRGCQRDLDDIVKAIEELMALKAMELNLTDEEKWAA